MRFDSLTFAERRLVIDIFLKVQRISNMVRLSVLQTQKGR